MVSQNKMAVFCCPRSLTAFECPSSFKSVHQQTLTSITALGVLIFLPFSATTIAHPSLQPGLQQGEPFAQTSFIQRWSCSFGRILICFLSLDCHSDNDRILLACLASLHRLMHIPSITNPHNRDALNSSIPSHVESLMNLSTTGGCLIRSDGSTPTRSGIANVVSRTRSRVDMSESISSSLGI